MNRIIKGDCLEVMKEFNNEIIDLTFTSPPYYNVKDYQQYESYEAYLDMLHMIINEIHRITKEGRFFVINTSPIIIPREKRSEQSKRLNITFDLHQRIVNSGWLFIEDIIWIKPEPSVKNRIGQFFQNRKPLTYKPNIVNEYIMVYRKQTDKLIDWNLKQYNKEITQQSLVDNIETSNIWNISPVKDKIHPAPFPIKLAENVIKCWSFINDLVFDPFAGIGTVGLASKKLNRNYLLIEQHEKYINRFNELVNLA